jgi:hypothetical protein
LKSRHANAVTEIGDPVGQDFRFKKLPCKYPGE